jgi:hypothetical protein
MRSMSDTMDFPPNSIARKGFRLEFNDDFNTKELDTSNWIPYYLPQWSSRKMSKPEYEIRDGNLILKITASQKPWCPEFNGKIKCSSIQTGVFSGEPGSKLGQHKVDARCVVREEQKPESTYLPQYGYFEIRAKCLNTTSNVVSLWMIGFEDSPERCAEICIFEVKGHHVSKSKAIIGYGIHKFNDPKLKEAFFEEEFQLDLTKFHIYSAEWTSKSVIFYLDNKKVKEIHQSPDYRMQFMLGLYEIPAGGKDSTDEKYPKEFVVDYVRGYKRV